MDNHSQFNDNSTQTNDDKFIELEQLKELYFKQYPTDAHCWATVFSMISPDLKRCSACGSEKVTLVDDARKIKCGNCKKTKRLTAGTFFHRIRAIRAWFGAIWLMERGVTFSAFWLHKAFAVAYSTAWMILKKLSMVLHQSVPHDSSQLPSSLFKALFGRRSRETPAREHPREEQSEVERQHNRNVDEPNADRHTGRAAEDNKQNHGRENMQMDGAEQTAQTDSHFNFNDKGNGNNNNNVAEPLESQLLSLLSNKPVHAEELLGKTTAQSGDLSSALMLLEIQGLIKRLPGEFYVRIDGLKTETNYDAASFDIALKPENASTLNGFKQSVQLIFHRISRKYLQLFIYNYWCQLDRKRWGEGALLDACLQSNFIEDHEVTNFVSPILVWFPSQSSKSRGMSLCS